ncbi:GLPGLI family protein [Hymenobacter sp. H14-R3]|uniref:GLPGLI family protein n=1 Tax=Hymenobacter sp. H14-R3 TaxID=3046308 RepID=UPI0024B98C7F|nr:GLPGLI family protein [Hymenobacter sp. H14-R3]MDJ0365450.1 GLPGLI family protein [Hymenobacter sp. H14-R3]
MTKLLIFFAWVCVIRNGVGQPMQSATGANVKLACTYRLIFRPDSTSPNTLTEKMQLLVAGEFSEFKSVPQARDSIKAAILAKGDANGINNEDIGRSISAMLRAPSRKFNYSVYKFFSNKQCVVYDDIMREHYKYEEVKYPLTWQLFATTAKVGDYKCQKATTYFAGRQYEAWFTREIPVSEGPYKFSGLPGLIIKISDVTNSYTFELIGLEKPTRLYSIGLPTQLTMSTTKRLFFEAVKSTRENAVNLASQSGVTFKNPDLVRAHLTEKIKRSNNPIELKY